MAGAKRGKRSGATQPGGVRERIVDAALVILRESGLQRLTQVQVAERAGVRQSHLTYYFPTREDLLEAVTARAVQGIAHHMAHAVGAEGSGHGPLLARLAAAEADRGHMRMFLGLIVEADGDPALRAMLVDGTHRLEAAIADALGGDDAKERARLVLAALWGLGLYQFVMRPPTKSNPTGPYLSWLTEVAAALRGPSRPGGRGPTTRE